MDHTNKWKDLWYNNPKNLIINSCKIIIPMDSTIGEITLNNNPLLYFQHHRQQLTYYVPTIVVEPYHIGGCI